MPLRRYSVCEPLRLAGLVPLSSVDWPGKLVATAFTQGCPWDCLYCHNRALIPFVRGGTEGPSLPARVETGACSKASRSSFGAGDGGVKAAEVAVGAQVGAGSAGLGGDDAPRNRDFRPGDGQLAPGAGQRETGRAFHVKPKAASPAPPTEDDLFSLLGRRRGLLDGVVISGGEPLAQAGLPRTLEKIGELGFLRGLHTGGTWPARLEGLLARGLLDWVGLDIKAFPASYERVVGRVGAGDKAWAALETLLASEIDYEVRLTWYEQHPDRLLELGEALARRGVKKLALQAARSPAERCPRGEITPPQLQAEQVHALADLFPEFELRA